MSRPHNLLDLVGRRADSFSREEFAALPLLTSFTKSYLAGTSHEAGRAWTKTERGWVCDVFPGETHDADVVLSIPDLVCIAVGEPRGDTVHALTVLDALLPLPKRPLHERAADLAYGTRSGRVPAAALEELGQAMHRIRRICVETGMSLSIVVAPDIAEVQILGAKPDPISAVQVPNSDHKHYRDAAGTRFMWRA